MINLTQSKTAVETLTRAATRIDREPGQKYVYFQGDYSSEVNRTAIGKAAWALMQAGKLRLVQRIVTKEPRLYDYIAVVA